MSALAAILKSIYCTHSHFNFAKKKHGVTHRLKAIVGFSTIFSVTWISGVPLLLTRHVAFQYLFCLLCTLQGFYIFLLFCLRSKKARLYWRLLLRGKSSKDIKRHILSLRRIEEMPSRQSTEKGS